MAELQCILKTEKFVAESPYSRKQLIHLTLNSIGDTNPLLFPCYSPLSYEITKISILVAYCGILRLILVDSILYSCVRQ